MVAAVAVDESGPAVVAAADDDDDVMRPAPRDIRDHNSKLSISQSPISNKAPAAQERHVAHGDVIDSDSGGSDEKGEATEETAKTEIPDHQPPDRGKYRNEELVQCDTCKGMFLTQSLLDHVVLCKKNTAKSLNFGDDIFQCKLCDYRGRWYSSHSRQHIAGKLYKCSVCSHASSDYGAVRLHCRQTQFCSAKNATCESTGAAIEGCVDARREEQQ